MPVTNLTSKPAFYFAASQVPLMISLLLDLPAKNSASDRPPSNSHVVSCLSARICTASLNEGQSFVSHGKTSAGLSFSSMPLLGAMLVRSAAVELGSRAHTHQNGARPS